jgi:hypothetical protein
VKIRKRGAAAGQNRAPVVLELAKDGADLLEYTS